MIEMRLMGSEAGEREEGGREESKRTSDDVDTVNEGSSEEQKIDLESQSSAAATTIDSSSATLEDLEEGDLQLIEDYSQSKLKRHVKDNLAFYLPIAVAIVCAVVIVSVGFALGSAPLNISPDAPCLECFQGEADECGFVPASFYPFSERQPVRRNYRFQYNGNPGAKIYEASVSLDTVFRAIFGDVTARKESLIFRWVKDAVTNKSTSIYYNKGLQEYFNITDKLIATAEEYLHQQQQSENTTTTVSNFRGMCATEYAMNNFWRNLTRNQIEVFNLRYNTTQNGFDNHGGFSVWSTIYPELMPVYGPIVVVFKPEVTKKGQYPRNSPPRTIDLNIWNYQKTGYFVFPNSNHRCDVDSHDD
eukprot:TRINITY_DN4386_c0_g3_i2.p1 TRINITY_DN4386_c0_g3~~TRINITY_DN4386_c0_g3_i2.p1  ORF type:complete len:361 (-),score=89.73 TRINITY_DN4386_c0_g3_i2:784-1866(-)